MSPRGDAGRRPGDVPGFHWIERASALVPRPRREEWRREWEAEVAYAWRRMSRDGAPPLGSRLRLRARVLTCWIDALWERMETMKTTGWTNDLRQAARSLARRPMFTGVAVLTLALGIGATTAVFTLVYTVLLRPLPHDEAASLVAVRHLGREGRDALPMSEGLYGLYRERASSLESIGLHFPSLANVVWEDEPERMQIRYATPSFFEVLRAEAALGRTFTEAEGAPDGEPVVVLSDGLWRERFGGSPSAIGATVDVGGVTREVVGVMPPRFGHPDTDARMWLPLVVDPVEAQLASFGADGIARLGPRASLATLQVELEGLVGRLAELFPDSGAPAFLSEVGVRPLVIPLKEEVVGSVERTLWVLLGTVGFVLLIACANVANLLLVRAEGRQRELALRAAVGAGRWRIAVGFLAESGLLALGGGLLGIALAAGAVRASMAVVPADLPRVTEIGIDVRVLAFAAAVSGGCALLFGLFPLLRLGLSDLSAQLREGGARGATGSRGRQRLRHGLVVAQVALAFVLLAGAGLMARSFQALRSVDAGFETENLLVARLTVPPAEVESWEETARFFRDLGERVRERPGVVAAGLAANAPLAGYLNYTGIEVEDQPRGPNELPVFANNNYAEAGYLEAIGTELLAGRTFQRGDGAEGARVVVVSRSFAETNWPGVSPLGRRMRLGLPDEEWYEVVGVVEDARYRGLASPEVEMVYWPATVGPASAPFPTRTMEIAVRTAGDPTAFVAALREEVRALNPRIPLSTPTTMEERVTSATSRTSFTMALLATASGVALLLGLVGIYGVVSYVVSQRTREIGVRMALGATAPALRGSVVRQGVGMAGLGLGVGALAAFGLSSVMESLVYGVGTTDPLTYAGVSLALLAVAVVASWLPARRASGVDPSRALRAE